MTSKTANGSTWTYTWDAENRLRKVDRDAVEIARFAYDVLGRRVERVAGGITYSYDYQGEDVTSELRSNGVSLKFFHGPGVDDVLARTDGSSTRYYQTNALGSVVTATDQFGGAVASYDYDPWGNLLPGADTPQSAGFTGREWDSETALAFHRARYYSPELGRFISEDPISVNQRPHWDINGFSYAANNPVNRTDPLGLMSLCAFFYPNPCIRMPRILPRAGPNDHCGPPASGPGSYAGSAFIAWLVPEGIPGVDFRTCCRDHDRCYGVPCPRRRPCCDMELSNCIMNRCIEAGQGFVGKEPSFCALTAVAHGAVVTTTAGGQYECR